MKALRLVICATALLIPSGIAAQNAAPAKKATAPAAKAAAGEKSKRAPAAAAKAKVVGKFGDWNLVCQSTEKKETSPCSLVQTLVQKDTNKLVFRLTAAFGAGGNLVLVLLAPVSLDLKRGIEFSPGGKKFYRAAFQTCLTHGCRAILPLDNDLLKDMSSAQQGTLTVYALNGRALRAAASMADFAKGLAELRKRRKEG